MVNVSDTAMNELNNFFADKEKSPIRVFLSPGGCSGPMMALALDEPTENDEVMENDGYKFVVEKELYEKAKPISIDMTPMGFMVDSALPLGDAGGGGCGGCSGC